MCVVSFIGDHYNDKWAQPKYQQIITNFPEVTRADFEQLKKEVEELKQLLGKAKIYDQENNQADCEIEDKMEKLRAIAKLVNIDLDEVLGKKK